MFLLVHHLLVLLLYMNFNLVSILLLYLHPIFFGQNISPLIGERSVSDEFFDHYLASIQSGFEIDMKLEYCYDIQRDLYWLTKIQLISHSLILLHFLGLPEDDRSNDFWTYVYEQRCHPIGWCKENSKLMLPPPIVTKRAIQQTVLNNNIMTNGNEKQSIVIKEENGDVYQTPPAYLFNKVIFFWIVKQFIFFVLINLQKDFIC